MGDVPFREQASDDPDASGDPGALPVARPDFARRLGGPADFPAAEPARLVLSGGGPFPKRAERYLSAVTKLGRLYTTLKDVLRRVAMLETRLDADRHDRDDAANRLSDLGARIEAGDIPGLDPLRGEIGDIRRLLDEEKAAGAETRLDIRARLDGIGETADRATEERARQSRDIEALRVELAETARALRESLAARESEQAILARAYSDLTRRLDLVRSGTVSTPSPPPERAGLDALLDAFYARLEDRFRGSREEIGRRLLKYVPDAEAATARTGKPVLDLGCGRGEWLELLNARDIDATGIDLNEMQLRDAQALGLDVRHGEAAAFLAEQPDGSFGMITAHHLAEHLPFGDLVWLTREALRVLAPGGVLLYETPNPANLIVGASNFHIDPTHIRPLPSQPLVTLFDTVGFHPVEARFLHPHPKQDRLPEQGRVDPEIAGLLFGPQDLAVLGTKPDIAA